MNRILMLILTLAMVTGAQATCTLTSGSPKVLTIGSQTIHVDADAPVSTSKSIAQYDTPTVGNNIVWELCDPLTPYGKRPLNLGSQDVATKIYPTDIPGVGVKLLFSNGSAFGNFPSDSFMKSTAMNPEEERLRFSIDGISFYRVEFYKISDNLLLSNPAGDQVLSAKDVGYHYMNFPDPESYILKLAVGEIKIVSTPACTTDGEKKIDFNDVTPALLKSGVERELNFSIVCKTDYGSYGSEASITTSTGSTNGEYIQVTDAEGNTDRLGIRIANSSGKILKVDGSESEQKMNISSQGATDYHWKATLISTGSAPASGKFTARAEIVFDIK